jgi:hypothetical protein
MNSYWIEQQARQHIDELAAEAFGDQLAHAEATAQGQAGRAAAFRRVVTRLAHARLDTISWRRRREAARVR